MFFTTADGKRTFFSGETAIFDCDGRRRMNVFSMLRYCQELANVHATVFGAGERALAAQNCVFVLSRVSLRVYRPLTLGQAFTGETWARGTQGMLHLRDAAFWNAEGALAFTCTSGWVLVRPDDHHILRPKDLPPLALPLMPQRALQTEHFSRLALPPSMAPAGQVQVQWSDIDFLGHMNNCAYGRIAVDVLPPALQATPLTGLDIHFKGEALAGETLSVFSARQDNAVFQYADHGRGRCYEALCAFDPQPPPAPGAPTCFVP